MKKTLIIFTLSFALLSFNSCKDEEEKKEDPKVITPKTKTQMLTTGKWVTDSGTITPNIIIDIFGIKDTIATYSELLAALGQGQDCYKDNQLWFLNDSTVVNDEGATKCNSADPQQTPGGTWKFLDNETKIEVVGNDNFDAMEAGPMTINELTESKMVVSFEATNNASGGAPTKHNVKLHFSNKK